MWYSIWKTGIDGLLWFTLPCIVSKVTVWKRCRDIVGAFSVYCGDRQSTLGSVVEGSGYRNAMLRNSCSARYVSLDVLTLKYISNLLYVSSVKKLYCRYKISAAGKHNEKRESYGHSLIIDPWGAIIGQLGDPLATGIALAEIDLAKLQSIRERMPVDDHRSVGSVRF